MSLIETTISLDPSKDFHSPEIKPEITPRKNGFTDKINFLLCGTCFWSASSFHHNEAAIRCPTCGSDGVESLPISKGEVYRLSHNKNRGITLEFSSHKGVMK
jgi:ribosomal protein S27E